MINIVINTIAVGIGTAFGFVAGVVVALGFVALSDMEVYFKGHHRNDVRNQEEGKNEKMVN